MESVGDISAEEYEAYAKVWWLTDGRLTGVGAMDAAKRLENETAETEFIEGLALKFTGDMALYGPFMEVSA